MFRGILKSRRKPRFAGIISVVVFAIAVGAFAVETIRLSEVTPQNDLNFADITAVPIGMAVTNPDVRIPDGGGDVVQMNVPRDLSAGGKCGALRVSGLLLERRTKKILGAMGSCVHPSVQEGVAAITNGIQKAVISASGNTALVVPLVMEKDRSGTVRYWWKRDGRELELLVKCYANERRQMAVCTLLHVKGDGILGGLGEGLQDKPNKKGTTK